MMTMLIIASYDDDDMVHPFMIRDNDDDKGSEHVFVGLCLEFQKNTELH